MGLFFFRKEIEREQFAQRLDYLDSELEKLGSKLYDLYQDAPLSKQVEFANNLKLADEKINKYATRQIGIERDLKVLNDMKSEFQVLKSKVDSLIDFANKLTIGDDSIYQTVKRIIEKELPFIIQNEVAKQIQAAKVVEMAHEKHPSLSKRMKVKRYSGTFDQTYYDRPFQIAMEMQGKYVQREIADKLNEYGFKTPQGNEFRQGNVSDMLQNKWLLSRFHKFEQKHGKLHEPVDFIHGLS